MPFLQLTFDIGKADPTPIEAALFSVGATAVTLQDAADDPILEPAPGAIPLWPTITIKALFSGDADAVQIAKQLYRLLDSLPPHRAETLADRPWEREWLKDFKPMQFGKRLWVCPGGMLPPSPFGPVASGQLANAIVLLDPGLAFGTGTHPTTALCLEWLESADLENKNMIDYGSGSGILAIAALKLGARSVIGIDIDAQALTASRDNAERNNVTERFALCDASTSVAATDVLLANILAGPLHELAPKFAEQVLPAGRLVLSGILKNQTAELASHYATWFDMDAPVYREDWALLTGTRL